MARKRTHTRRPARSRPRGRLELHRGGYGFVQTAEGEFFIPRSKVRDAFPGDLVEVAPSGSGRGRGRHTAPAAGHKRTARVVAVVERATDQVVGTYRRSEPFGVVRPLDERIQHDIFTPLDAALAIADGSIVRVAIDAFPDRYTAATGHVVEVMGDGDDERIPIDLIVARHKLETEFSAASLVQAAAAAVDEGEALEEGYRDLRDRFVFTIDPADARDFDDAVSLEEAALPDGRSGWRLGVHIADVSHYVPWGSSADLDARRRATSVYLVDRVIPMLPEALSNEVCSLKPLEPRRTMTVDLLMTGEGEVAAADIYPALITSRARLAYEQAQAFIEGREPQPCGSAAAPDAALAAELSPRIRTLASLADRARRRRQAAGGLDFDTVEAKVRLDGEGSPVGIDLRERTEATGLIEEAMILANEAVARFLHDAGFPCMYRVHEAPAPDSLEGLVPVLAEFAWFKEINAPRFVAGDPHAIQSVLAAAAGRPEAVLVTSLVLRAMKRAVYSPDLAPHFGLASSAYAHFTSPIRRYPDLVVHRMLKAALFGRPEKFDQEVTNLSWLAEHSSAMERTAEQAARESQEMKIIELMEAEVGRTFSATITGVAGFGLFVRLDNTAEGMVEIADLGSEYFALDTVRHTLTGTDTGKEYRLGRRIAVRLVEADWRTRTLRFRLA